MKRVSSISGYEMFVVQMLYSGAAAGFIYPSFIIRSTEGSLWIPIAVWAAGAIFSSWIYCRLLARLNGEKLVVQIHASIGIVGTCLICLPVFLFLFAALMVMLRAYTEIITMTMLPTTPIAFLNGMLLAPAALALAGTMPIVRTARVFFLMTTVFTLALMLVSLSDANWTLGTPWMKMNGDFLFNRRFYSGSFMWMGFVLTSLIGSYTKESARRAWKSYVLALICSFPLIAGYIYMPILTFGRELSERLTFPFVSKMDSIYSYWIIFENLTALFVSVTMLYVLLTMALKLHAIGEMFAALMPRTNIKATYIGIFVIVYAAATMLPSWRVVEDIILLTAGFRFYVMFVFPLIAIGVLAYGQRRRKERGL